MADHCSRPGAKFWQKAINGLDREFGHPSQLHAAKPSCCTAAYPGTTCCFATWSCNGWGVSPSNPVTASLHQTLYFRCIKNICLKWEDWWCTCICMYEFNIIQKFKSWNELKGQSGVHSFFPLANNYVQKSRLCPMSYLIHSWSCTSR